MSTALQSSVMSRQVLNWLVALSWLSVSSCACSNPLNHAIAEGKSMAETILTDQDNGRLIEVPVGTGLIVRLDESPTTGYVWINKTAEDVLHLNSTEFSSASPDIVGGAGLRTFGFMVNKLGKSTLLLKRMRDWKGESAATEVFSVTIQAIKK
ncbi:MAG: hypothetical protein CTY13_05920 [Methylobacter sp.]|nr:MAG: hypothetical protein CTY13_05920 [Methylobacter sp.]